jgi:hypothetical protein
MRYATAGCRLSTRRPATDCPLTTDQRMRPEISSITFLFMTRKTRQNTIVIAPTNFYVLRGPGADAAAAAAAIRACFSHVCDCRTFGRSLVTLLTGGST